MSLSKEFPLLIKTLKKYMSTRQAKAALRKVKKATWLEDTDNLASSFTWSRTPQGHVFWSSLNYKINQKCNPDWI